MVYYPWGELLVYYVWVGLYCRRDKRWNPLCLFASASASDRVLFSSQLSVRPSILSPKTAIFLGVIGQPPSSNTANTA